jgi:penicillin amidase
VPGDGRYEWAGYLPIELKPNIYNPDKKFWATANANLIPRDYAHRNAVGWTWADPFRADRVEEVLASGRQHTLLDMVQLQSDYLSIPARTLVPLLKELRSDDERTEKAREMLLSWDCVLDKDSIASGIYVTLERRLQENSAKLFIPDTVRNFLRRISMQKMINWLVVPPPEFGDDPLAGRDAFLLRSLTEAVEGLTERLGPDMSTWHLGRYKHALIRHPLSEAVDIEIRKKLDVGPVARGGNSYTVNNTGRGDNQTSGASFRIIVDTSDWNLTLGMNNPGQSGDPDSPFYRNLFEYWAKDRFFPVFYSRQKVESVASEIIVLKPES